jgi:hypothetical protein
LLIAIALVAVAGAATTAGPPKCTGDACAHVGLELRGGCVWLQNRSTQAIDVELQLAKGTITVALEAADPAKASARAARMAKGKSASPVPAQEAYERKKCENAENAKKRYDDMNARGIRAPIPPELVRQLEACRNAPRQEDRPKVEETSYHAQVYNPFSKSWGGAVYWVRVPAAGGCLAKLDDIVGYRAISAAPGK